MDYHVSDGITLDVANNGSSGSFLALNLDVQDSVLASLGQSLDEFGGGELKGDGIEVSTVDIGGGEAVAPQESSLLALRFANIYGQLYGVHGIGISGHCYRFLASPQIEGERTLCYHISSLDSGKGDGQAEETGVNPSEELS